MISTQNTDSTCMQTEQQEISAKMLVGIITLIINYTEDQLQKMESSMRRIRQVWA